MIQLLFTKPLEFLIIFGVLCLTIAIHEYAHAYTADKLGDPTAKLMGRLTFNPLAHLDPIGTLLILFVGFGWGKPVPFDPFNLRNPKKDAAIISAAGAASNLAMAIIASLFLYATNNIPFFGLHVFIYEIFSTLIYFNVILAVFNLIPIHPLDGFKVVAGLLPKKYYHDWMSLERYGMIFLLLLIFPFFGKAPISYILSPIIDFFLSFLIPGKVGGII